MFAFHQQLLDDTVRTNAFREAISRVVRPGDVVLEIGAGTGLLSFFACDAGARHVYAIEQQHSADGAHLLAKRFGYSDRLTVIHSPSHAAELPERADVLITETLGSLGFDESFLRTLVDARERFLAPDARIIPSEIALWIAPVELPELFAKYIDWWSAPRYGFDFSPIRLFAANTFYSDRMPAGALLAPLQHLDPLDARTSGTQYGGNAAFRATRRGTQHGFALGFTATLAPGVTITNAWSGADSWERGFLPLEQPVDVTPDTPISIDLHTDNGRQWQWRGSIGDAAFDQTTLLARPPCMLERRGL